MMHLQALLGDRLLANEPLARYTAARLGGPADWLYIARESTDELVEVVKAAWESDLPVRVLGGGANVLVADSGFRGLIVINHISEVTFGDWHDGTQCGGDGGHWTGCVGAQMSGEGAGRDGMGGERAGDGGGRGGEQRGRAWW